MKTARVLLLALGCALAASVADAQTSQLKSGNFNNTYIPPSEPPVADNELTVPSDPPFSNYHGMGGSTSSVGPISNSSILAERFPSNPSKTLILVKNTVGGIFISGAPRYLLGDEITPPLADIAGNPFAGATEEAKLAAARVYWRPQPALPGENIPGLGFLSVRRYWT
jgi:hypothetical protein